MFGSGILDTAIGVVFGFLAVSLFTSAVLEAIRSGLKTRAVNLRSAIMQLVNDDTFTGLAHDLYQHALISPFGPGAPAPDADAKDVKASETAYKQRRNWPSYIDKAQFARAFLDVTELTPKVADLAKAVQTADRAAKTLVAGAPAPDPVEDAVKALKTEIKKIENPQIEAFLNGAVDRAGGDIEHIEKQIADWFDASMDRLSGTFKRWSQLFTVVIAFVVAAFANIDSIHIGRQIWAHPELARNLQASDLSKLDVANEVSALDKIATLLGGDFPIGWPTGTPFMVLDPAGPTQAAAPGAAPAAAPAAPAHEPRWMTWTDYLSPLGWLITAIAALFGAPFWFDTLQSLVRLKGAGPSPDEKKDGKAASA